MTKKQRTQQGAATLKYVRERYELYPPDALTALLADVRHACDLKKLDYAKLDREAYRIYLEELS